MNVDSLQKSYIMSMTEIHRTQDLIGYSFNHRFRYTEMKGEKIDWERIGRFLITHFDGIQVRQVPFDRNIRKLNEVYVFVWF